MKSVETRYRVRDDYQSAVPVHVVWEITLACNLKCTHCGSRAGKIREGELTTQQCFEVINSLKRLGTRSITIIGGEAFLRKDWLQIIEYITQNGIECGMQTGAYNLTEERIIAAKNAGIKTIGVSIDGLRDTHNKIRGRDDSFEQAILCLQLLHKHQLTPNVNTVITKLNKDELAEITDLLIENKVKNWQIQLAVAMGNAVDNSEELLIQPYELIELYNQLAQIHYRARAGDILIQAGNNIGYFGPYESLWRIGAEDYYTGCSAGHTAIGIEADGTIKGCPSLPTSDYAGGNIKEMKLEDIWQYREEMFFTRYRNPEELWGGCKNCYYSSVCLAGCVWTSTVLFGKRGNNPFCHHRALELQKKGLKEEIRKIKEAPGKSFDTGLFEILVKNEKNEIVEIQSASMAPNVPLLQNSQPRIAPVLLQCMNCNNHVFESEIECPFCGVDIKKTKEEYSKNLEVAQKAMDVLSDLMKK